MAGRHSAAEYLTPVIDLPVSRPEPPPDLSPAEATEWREIVGRLRPDWFPRETHALLSQLCHHIVVSRDLRARLKRTRELAVRLEILREIRSQSLVLRTLHTTMRLTQQSRHDPKRSTGGLSKRPWEPTTRND